MKFLIGVLSFFVTALSAGGAGTSSENGSENGSENDCALGARYLELAAKAEQEFRQDDAYQFVERAAEACPSHATWLQLGELAAGFGEEARNERAAEAFVTAYELGATSAEQAVAVGRYAELLFHTNDPQKALTYVLEARGLDPDNAWLADLAGTISERAANVTAEDIKRGLGDMAFKPLRLQRSVDAGDGSAGGGAASAAVGEPRRAVNIPLNFELNSTVLDRWTRKNITVLAQTLVDPEYAGRRFLLLGHADVRGGANENMLLSVERANAIAAEIVQLQPELQGRMRTAGKGEEQPLSTGVTEEDHRVNRRLEVVLE